MKLFPATSSTSQVSLDDAGERVTGLSYTDASGEKKQLEGLDACVLALGYSLPSCPRSLERGGQPIAPPLV